MKFGYRDGIVEEKIVTTATLVSRSTTPEVTVTFSAQSETTVDAVPLSIFSGELSGLRALVKYLHEQRQYSFSLIASILNRDPRTIWTTYAAAKDIPSASQSTASFVPLHIFADRDASILEHLVYHLKQSGLTFAAIARTLNKDQRTVWTAFHRYKA